ncbi:MAG: hypothetical protein KIT58_10710 [Planctomycetota bacterium]|nr:hypothetical protein [Planctomycetota bacterium]
MAGVGDTRVQVQPRDGERDCVYCRGACDDSDLTCDGCRASYHPDCLAELGACATLGCPRPRAGGRRRIVVQPLRCCTSRSDGRVVLCDACGGRWHEACLVDRGGRCCAGHGVTPEVVPGRARDRGPRPGEERECVGCRATFRVEAATRFSTRCRSCRARFTTVAVVLVVLAYFGLLASQLLMVFLTR